jgi:Ion transport protein
LIRNSVLILAAYYEQGMMVHDSGKLRHHYLTSSNFKCDVISVLPTDIFYLCWFKPGAAILRANRLLRISRLWQFVDWTESRTSSPNSFRIAILVLYLIIIIHWNACFYLLLSDWIGFGTDGWVYFDVNETLYPENGSLITMYTYR